MLAGRTFLLLLQNPNRHVGGTILGKLRYLGPDDLSSTATRCVSFFQIILPSVRPQKHLPAGVVLGSLVVLGPG